MAFSLPARGLLTALAIFMLDQWSKWWALDLLRLPNQPRAVTEFFNLVLVWNRGISFGMFASHADAARWLLIGMTLAILVFLLRWLRGAEGPLVASGLGFVIGGASGNLLDRFRFGAVADFLDFHIMGYHWPAFNLADSAIVLGVGLLCWDSLFRKQALA